MSIHPITNILAQRSAIVTNLYQFQSEEALSLHEYKVTVHPKMEKTLFYK